MTLRIESAADLPADLQERNKDVLGIGSPVNSEADSQKAVSKLLGERQHEEADLDGTILRLAHLYGYMAAHFRPARTDKGWRTAVSGDGAGYPDWHLVRPGRSVFIETKSTKGKVSQAQQVWHEVLRAAGIEVIVARPQDVERLIEVLK